MRILITGGTGFLGQALAHRLHTLSAQVTVMGRNIAIGQQLQQAGLRFIYADLTDLATVITACHQQDMVFHCAARSAPWGQFEAFYTANVIGTQNIIQACFQQNIKRLIYISTPAIHFDYVDKQNLSEGAPLPFYFANHYAKTKYMAEQAIDQAHAEGLPVITLRPRAIFGPGDNTLFPRLLTQLQRGRLPIIGSGQAITDLTYIDNVVAGLLCCLDSPAQTLGRKYHLTNGEPVAIWSLIRHLSEQLGYPPPQRHVPRSVAYFIASVVEKYYALVHPTQEPPLTRYSLGLISTTFTLNITAAQQELGYQPTVSMEEAIARFLRYWQS